MANIKTTQTMDALALYVKQAPKGSLVVLDFWADWAEPSKHMNEVVDELAKQHKDVLFVKIEADNSPDISEKYEVEAVPTFILLQNGSTVGRINGANAAELTQKIYSFSKPKAVTATTATSTPSSAKAGTKDAPVELTPELKKRLEALTKSAKCIAFIKGTPEQPRCGFTRQLVDLFEKNKIDYTTFNIFEDDEVRQGLKVYSDWPTFPQVYADGDFVGGLDIIKEMEGSGELKSVLPTKKPSNLTARLEELINSSPIMLFMKGTPDTPRCGFSAKIVGILNEIGVTYKTFDIFEDEDVRQGLKTYVNWPTYPMLFHHGQLLGGLDIIQEMKENGELLPTLSS